MSTTQAQGAQEYVVLLYGDEQPWREADEATRVREYARHGEFSRLCEEQGHEITGGAELRLSETALVVRTRGDDVQVTEGPFAETTEQLGGYYVVRTADVHALARLVAMLGGTSEIRPVVPASEYPDAEAPAEPVEARA